MRCVLHAAAPQALDFSLVGKSILVVPGGGGVGSYVIQLAKQLLGLTVIATASRAESRDACLALGADFVVNHRDPFKPQLAAIGIPQVGLGVVGACYVTAASLTVLLISRSGALLCSCPTS